MDCDVLGPIMAFSNQLLKDPPIYQVINGILHILFYFVCTGPPSLETLKHAPLPSILPTSRCTLACCIEALLVDCGGATQPWYPCQLHPAIHLPAIRVPPCWQGLCGYVLEHWVGGCSGIWELIYGTWLLLLMLILSLLSPLFDSLDSLSIPPASFEMLVSNTCCATFKPWWSEFYLRRNPFLPENASQKPVAGPASKGTLFMLYSHHLSPKNIVYMYGLNIHKGQMVFITR